MEWNRPMKTSQWIFWSLYLFIFLYAPPLIPYPHLIMGIIVFIVMLFSEKKPYLMTARESNITLWGKVMLSVFLYALLIPLPVSFIYNDIVDLPHYYHLFNRFAILVFMELICGTYILTKFKEKKYTLLNIINLLIVVSIIQSFFACAAFFIPQIKTFFLTLMITVGKMGTDNTGVLLNRTFGFANNLLDHFGYGTGLLAGISFFLGVNYRKRYIIFSIIIILAALFNSRSGLLIFFIAIVLTGIFSILVTKSIKGFFKTVIILFFIPTIFVSSLEIIATYNDTTSEWITKGVNSIIEFADTGSSDQDAMKSITSDDFWELPNDERIIIGTGHSRYEAEGYQHTDNGLVNDIWFVGILGLFLLYGIVIYLCYKILQESNNSFEQFISIFLLCSFLIFNIKAVAIGYNLGGTVSFFVIFATRMYQSLRNFEGGVE